MYLLGLSTQWHNMASPRRGGTLPVRSVRLAGSSRLLVLLACLTDLVIAKQGARAAVSGVVDGLSRPRRAEVDARPTQQKRTNWGPGCAAFQLLDTARAPVLSRSTPQSATTWCALGGQHERAPSRAAEHWLRSSARCAEEHERTPDRSSWNGPDRCCPWAARRRFREPLDAGIPRQHSVESFTCPARHFDWWRAVAGPRGHGARPRTHENLHAVGTWQDGCFWTRPAPTPQHLHAVPLTMPGRRHYDYLGEARACSSPPSD